MKNVILFAAALFAAISVTNAQSNTSTVKVNVILHPALSVEVDQSSLDQGNSGSALEENSAINLVYKTAADYQGGVTKAVNNHLKVTAVGTGYKIYAKTSAVELTRNAGNGDGAASTMSGEIVTVNVGNASPFSIKAISDNNNTTHTHGAYTVTGHDMVASTNSNSSSSVINAPVDVTYKARGLTTSEVQSFLGTNNTTGARYTVNVTYSILPN